MKQFILWLAMLVAAPGWAAEIGGALRHAID